eukprot:3553255-Rhodomonas_salina.1
MFDEDEKDDDDDEGGTGKGTTVCLIPRPGSKAAGTEPVLIQTDDPWFVIHHANAYEELLAEVPGGVPDKVVAYSTGWDKMTEGPFLSDWSRPDPLHRDLPRVADSNSQLSLSACADSHLGQTHRDSNPQP